MKNIIIKPIAFVVNNRNNVADDYWGSIVSEIKLIDEIPNEALDGVEAFSHLEILFYFHKSPTDSLSSYSNHPRENKKWPKVGIFAQRRKNRPNSIGATIVEIIERKPRSIFVKNLDADHGTPIIDIKPVLKEFLPQSDIRQPLWASELMENYWKKDIKQS